MKQVFRKLTDDMGEENDMDDKDELADLEMKIKYASPSNSCCCVTFRILALLQPPL